MLEFVVIAACIVSALACLCYLKNLNDELRQDRDTWKRRFIDAYMRDVSQEIEDDMNRHDLLPR